MTDKKFDLIVIGGGPAGYPAAIRAAQLGLTAACVDDWPVGEKGRAFGGTCLNVGCIPSKALLESTELYHRAQGEFARHGISTGEVSMDVGAMQARKRGIVEQLTGGIEALFKANNVTGIKGRGRLLSGGRVEVSNQDSTEVLTAENVILATGSTPIELPFAKFDGSRIVDSAGALDFDSVPKRLGVIGAGVIGLELGSVWRRLGSEVVLLEALEQFLPMVDQQIAKEAARQFKQQGLDIRLGAKVSHAAVEGDVVSVSYEQGGNTETIEFDRLIVCVGRKPMSADLIDPELNIDVDARGFIDVDEQCRTAAPGVWAVGDVVRGPMLAHKGTAEGVMAVELIAGLSAEVNYEAMPSVIYTAPEIAWVGLTEAEVEESGKPYKVGSFSFAANGRAKALEQAAGLVKIVVDEKYDEILGVHIVGPMAGELIAEAVLAIEFEASAEDLQRTVHAHPTLSEVLHEAALAADGHSLHAINK
jgi:dihydrolipoamide dehydrogenase